MLKLPVVTRFLYMALVLCATSPMLLAQPSDFRISPPDSSVYVQLPESKAQSASRIGDVSIVVWGTTIYDPADRAHRSELRMQMLRRRESFGAGRALHDTTFRPHGVVAALSLGDRFLVLWNDKRADAPGIYFRVIDTAGTFTTTPQLFAKDALLPLHDSIALVPVGNGHDIVWRDARSGIFRYLRQYVDSSGTPVGGTITIELPDFNDTLTFFDLPGVRITRRAGDMSEFVHADGTIDPRPVPTRHLSNPHVVRPDTSLLVLDTLPDKTRILRHYRRIFDTADTHRTPVAIPQSHGSRATIGLDSAQNIWIIYNRTQGGSHPGGTYVYSPLYRVTVGPDDQSTPPLLVDSMSVFGFWDVHTPSQYLKGSVVDARYIPGDDYLSQLFYVVHTSGVFKNSPESNYDRRDTVRVFFDRYGNRMRANPAISPYFSANVRRMLKVRRIADHDSSTVAVTIDSVDVRLAIPIERSPQFFAQTRPFITVHSDSITVAWEQGANVPTFGLAGFVEPDARDIRFFPFLVPDPVASYSGAGRSHRSLVNFVHAGNSSLVSYLSVDGYKPVDYYWQYTARRGMYLVSPGGWRQIDYLNQGVLEHDRTVSGYNPDTREALVSLASYGGTSIVAAYDPAGAKLWSVPIWARYHDGIIPLGGDRFGIAFRDSIQWFDSTKLVRTDHFSHASRSSARYHTLLGSQFLRCYASDGIDSAGLMLNPGFVVEKYNAQGRLLHRYRFSAPTRYFDFAIVERPVDSAIFICWGSDSGIRATALDKSLALWTRDSLISETTGRAKAPSAAFRGDLLYVVWEDYRNRDADIYGAFRMAPASPSISPISLPDGEGLRVTAAFPVPTRDIVHVDIDLPTAQEVRIRIVDVAGRMVRGEMARKLSGGQWRITSSTADLHPGTYFLVVEGEGGAQAVARFLVVR